MSLLYKARGKEDQELLAALPEHVSNHVPCAAAGYSLHSGTSSYGASLRGLVTLFPRCYE
jgi:hypothetical protein